MEVAQCTANKNLKPKVKFLDESGNFIVVFGIISLIAGAIGYFMTLSGNIDTEVRSLGATQRTVYMKSDLRETIRKTLMSKNTDCPAGMTSLLNNKFINFTAPIEDAKFSYNWKYVSGPPPIKIDTDPNARCFLHPSRYLGIDFRSVNIEMLRASEPNLITLNSFVTVNATIGFVSAGKPSVLKYSLRYRVDVLALNQFGFISTSPAKLFELNNDSSVKVQSWALVDQTTRTSLLSLTNFLNLPDTTKVRYNKKFWIASPGLSTDSDSLNFLKEKKIEDVFSYGIDFNVLPTTPAFKAPYQNKATEWVDVFNYDITDKYYALPKISGNQSAISSPTMGVVYKYSLNQDGTTPFNESGHNKTASIYNELFGNKNQIFKSCDQTTVTGQYNLLIFNNLNEEFIIDFSGNTDVTTPPVFCGLVAARKVTIILNDQDSAELKQNHFIGKIITKEPVVVVNKGELHINDIMDVTNDKIPYAINDLSNSKLQYYNQKYFSSQNFHLPFFKDQAIYTKNWNDPEGHYIPRATKNFFNSECAYPPAPPISGHKCRPNELDVPTKEALIANPTWRNALLYEVFNVE